MTKPRTRDRSPPAGHGGASVGTPLAQTFLASAIELVLLSSLLAYKGNARRHDERQVRKLAGIIREVGFIVPIVIDENNVIVAGPGRLDAAKTLHLVNVPVIRASHLTPEQVKAFRLADNKLGDMSCFDQRALALELATLDVDILDLTGFETAEIDVCIAGLETMEEQDTSDDTPEVGTAAVSRLGDLWQFGLHRLLCGSALDKTAYSRLLNGALARASFADPPYNVPVSGHVSGSGRIKHREFVQASGEMSEAEFIGFLTTYLSLAKRHCVDGALLYACIDALHSYELLSAARAADLHLKASCTWAKTNAGMGGLYRVQTEFVHVFKAGAAAHVNNVELGRYGRSRTTLWTYAGVNTFRRGRMSDLGMHPTVKPTALVIDAIKDCTHRGDIVLDPFSGSGTTIIAAEKVGRIGRAIEFDPLYVDVAIRRWERWSGRPATLVATGETFADVELRRAADTRSSAIGPNHPEAMEATNG